MLRSFWTKCNSTLLRNAKYNPYKMIAVHQLRMVHARGYNEFNDICILTLFYLFRELLIP